LRAALATTWRRVRGADMSHSQPSTLELYRCASNLMPPLSMSTLRPLTASMRPLVIHLAPLCSYAADAAASFMRMENLKVPSDRVRLVVEGKEPDAFWDYFVLG
jgi:hypothetical protein